MSVWKGDIFPPHSFLNCANLLLCLPHMLISCCGVKCYATICQVPAERLKFTLNQGLHHLKPCPLVDLPPTSTSANGGHFTMSDTTNNVNDTPENSTLSNNIATLQSEPVFDTESPSAKCRRCHCYFLFL